MTNDDEMALAALMKAAEAVDSAVSTELLRKSFAIQRNHQFDLDENRGASKIQLKTLLEAMIEEGGAV
jgi:hypothetical protein